MFYFPVLFPSRNVSILLFSRYTQEARYCKQTQTRHTQTNIHTSNIDYTKHWIPLSMRPHIWYREIPPVVRRFASHDLLPRMRSPSAGYNPTATRQTRTPHHPHRRCLIATNRHFVTPQRAKSTGGKNARRISSAPFTTSSPTSSTQVRFAEAFSPPTCGLMKCRPVSTAACTMPSTIVGGNCTPANASHCKCHLKGSDIVSSNQNMPLVLAKRPSNTACRRAIHWVVAGRFCQTYSSTVIFPTSLGWIVLRWKYALTVMARGSLKLANCRRVSDANNTMRA